MPPPPPKKPAASKKRGGKVEAVEAVVVESPTYVPFDQAKLTPKQLDEDITRVLTATNPLAPTNLVSYNYAERAYKAVPPMADDDVVYHFRQMAKTMHRQSDEFAAQEARNREFVDMVNEKRRLRQVAAQEEGKTLSPTELEEDDTQRNQFNFTERAAQTYNPTTKVRTISTTPPDSTNNSGAMTQWGLYDAYMLEFERLTSLANMEKNVKDAKARARAEAGSGGAHSAEDGSKSGGDPMHAPEMAARMRIMERIVNQNAEDEIYSDFKYWEDESDLAGLDDKGRLLPLWRFEDSRTRRKMVTALAWNVGFSDLFAVGYGSYDFMRQGSGLICVFTLKNVACPEYLFTAESGVMSLDFSDSAHPLLAVGCYDGSVRVYDVRKRENKPIFSSDGQKFKHSDPVWEVKWARAAPGAPQPAEPCFYSASSDGIMARWTVTKSELQYEPVLALKVLAAPPGDVPGGAIVAAAAAGGSGAAAAASSSSAAAAATAGAGALAASGQLVGGSSSSSSSSGGDLAATSASAVGSGIAAVAALRGEGAGSSSSSSSSSDGSGSGSAEAGSAPKVVGLAGCCCFAFSPLFPTEYLVGTEEGRIHKGSLETPGSVSATFGGGHGMAVYALRWNPWHPRVFLSCSADWTVRMWDDSHTSGPIARFDLNCAVSDCAWAPYSSTVFAATTEDQKVAVWDLAVNKKEPLCIQKTIPGKKNRCTHIAFNAAAPVILVGDIQGGVTSAKLSPNLRKIQPIPIPVQRKGEEPVPPPRRAEVEVRRLDAILAASDARISIVTPVPGGVAAKAEGEAVAEPEAAAE